MFRLMRSSFYKLFRDKTFHIILIIGVVVSVFMPLMYLLIDSTSGSGSIGDTCNGYNLLISSLSPTQNFGLAIPINLITFIIGEFNYGTIRNKIIAGNRKSYIYLSLFLNGLAFSFILLSIYVALCTIIATCIGGFSPSPLTADEIKFLFLYLLVTIFVYTTLTSLSVFLSTAIRAVGGSISITVIITMVGFIASMIYSVSLIGAETTLEIDSLMMLLNPLFLISIKSLGMVSSSDLLTVDNLILYQIISCVIYSALFYMAGNYIFKVRDIK